MSQKSEKLKKSEIIEDYSGFTKINGKHSLKDKVPDSCIEYQVRKRKGGRVRVFNFSLAKEMGLISQNHPHKMNKKLEKAIIEAFSLVIINEYDQINKISYPKNEILKNTYMATRYLQLQHPNKMGKTSGDGRSIWNGEVRYKGQHWDITSCGTGATQLSPATHLNNKFYKTGDPTISYGCGYSEIDEGLAAIFFSEVLHKNSIDTERVLAIIEFNKGISINVRAHPNLLRPSHFFCHLKQSNYDELKALTDYYLDRKKSQWKDMPEGEVKRLDYFLDQQVNIFAKMSARFESDYIFCWLDWDGDNILMDGGIIDYGSIRQFGLFHHEYRFDDVERFSTTIKEQKNKARYLVQSFCQMVDFLKKGQKKSINSFKNHKALRGFDELFFLYKKLFLLEKIGINTDEAKRVLIKNNKLVESFLKDFQYFERSKSAQGIEEVGDGINCSAVFCMRDILREIPQLFLMRDEKKLSHKEFISIIKSSYAVEEDLKLSTYRRGKIKSFQDNYLNIIKELSLIKKEKIDDTLLEVSMRSGVINRYDRITGDSITKIIMHLLSIRPKLTTDEYDKALHDFIDYQNLNPEYFNKKRDREDTCRSQLTKKMIKIVRDYREGL